MNAKGNVTGKIDEIAKKEKSWKAVIGGRSYYCTKDISHLAGRTITAEYQDSDPYDFKGKQVTSKFILYDTILIQGTGQNTANTQETAKTAQETPNIGTVAQGQKPTDWDGKERRGIRSMCLAYSKDLAVAGKIEVSEIENMATSFFNFIYEKPQEIPF